MGLKQVVSGAFLLRKLIVTLRETNSLLARIAEAEEKKLKFEMVRANFPSRLLDDLVPADDSSEPPQQEEQSEEELAFLERLEEAFTRVHGRPPNPDEDLVEIFQKEPFDLEGDRKR